MLDYRDRDDDLIDGWRRRLSKGECAMPDKPVKYAVAYRCTNGHKHIRNYPMSQKTYPRRLHCRECGEISEAPATAMNETRRAVDAIATRMAKRTA